VEDKNELSDIVLEKEDNKSQKIKRILLIAALLIVIFLITIVIMKVTNDSSTPINNNPKLNLPPEPIAKSVEQPKAQKDDELFKKVDIQEVDEKKESFEDMVKSLKEKEKKKIEEVVTKVKQEEPVPTKNKVNQVANEVKKQATKTIEKPAIKQTAKVENNNASIVPKGTYVQVGATSRLSPDKKFLALITNNKYNYKLLPIDVKGKKVTKILVGPYNSTNEAKKVIGDIKSKINKDAFIYRVR
jgi:DedD protein